MHNLGSFDGVFILKYLSQLPNLKERGFKCVIRNSEIYQIIIDNIFFRDSLKLLLGSLESLAKSFAIRDRKTRFDYKSLLSIDNIPKIILDGTLRAYNIHDVVILDKVMSKMRKIVCKSFDIELNECITLSSLSFKIFRKHYIKPYTLYKDSESYNINKFLSNSYRGGIVDVYKPYSEHVYSYDINSSYPHCMHNNRMPTGIPTWVDIKQSDLSNFFGFLKVDVIVPKDCYIALLGIRHNNNLIYPTG